MTSAFRAAALTCTLAAGALALSADHPWTRDILVERNLPVPMRDGVTLRADVYRPNEPGRFPALLMRTPYDKTGALQSGRLAMTVAGVRGGYVVVIQDTRGQYESEGRFVPYTQERLDGHDTIEWVATLPYVNGRVGTFGLSYPGAVQWMTAPTRPPALAAMVPAMTFAHHNHFVYHGGVFEAAFVHWLLGRQIRERRAFGLPFTSSEEIQTGWAREGDAWMRHLPLRDLPLMERFPYWQEWLDHPIESEYWAPFDIEAQHRLVDVPVLNFTGWNDDNYGQPGAIRNYTGMRKHGATPRARDGQRLIVGPWTHGVPTMSRTRYAGVDYGPNAAIDFTEPQLQFFDYWLKGQADPAYADSPPVRIFVMGDNVWREEREWPPARTRYQEWFLRAGGRLSAEAPGEEKPATFTYDPRRPVRMPDAGPEGGVDWRPVATRTGDLVAYTSDPLPRAMEITGHILAKIWAASSAPDTDFTVRLLDVSPDGVSRALTSAPGVLRARYRSTEAPEPPQPLTPGQPVELTISLGYTSGVVPAGHRLTLVVTGSMVPGLEVHLNTWEPFRSPAQAVTARQTIYQQAGRASRIILPVIPR